MVNKVGFGTFPLSGAFNKIRVSKAERLVQEFIEQGGFYLDTAPLYGNGEVEKLIGRALKRVPRKSYYLGTKTVKHIDKDGNLFKSGKYEDVINQFDNSLLRLGVEYVDQLMVHSLDSNVPIGETLAALEKLQSSGKVKDLAVSNVNIKELKEYNATGKIRYVQNKYSLINRSISAELENYLLESNIKLIPWHLLEIGLLTESAFEYLHLRKGDLREQLPYWDTRNQKVIFKWVRDSLSPIAKEAGITIGQLCIAWGLHQPFIDYVVVGTTKTEYMKINLNANNVKLNDDLLCKTERAYNAFVDIIQTEYKQTVPEFRSLNEKFY